MRNLRSNLLALGLALTTVVSLTAPSMAQEAGPGGPPPMMAPRHAMHHSIQGRVLSFRAFRVTMRRRNGDVQTIDLKQGTVIRPLGATPHEGDHIMARGYFSDGRFIANEIVLR